MKTEDLIKPNQKKAKIPEAKDRYEMTIALEDTAKLMTSSDYKERFIAEYAQLKIRYERLKYLLTKWEAFGRRFESDIKREPSDVIMGFVNWLGFLPNCSKELLEEQELQMRMLLHILEVRAVIEDINLKGVTIKI